MVANCSFLGFTVTMFGDAVFMLDAVMRRCPAVDRLSIFPLAMLVTNTACHMCMFLLLNYRIRPNKCTVRLNKFYRIRPNKCTVRSNKFYCIQPNKRTVRVNKFGLRKNAKEAVPLNMHQN